MCNTSETASDQIHVWEKAGLGAYPYTFIGMSENVYVTGGGSHRQPGGTCHYCGTAIQYQYEFISADGKRFHVGSDCVRKWAEAGIVNRAKYDAALAQERRRKAHDKAIAQRAELNEIMSTRASDLAALPHPQGFKDRVTGKPLTLLDYARWYEANAGDSGRASALRMVKRQLAI